MKFNHCFIIILFLFSKTIMVAQVNTVQIGDTISEEEFNNISQQTRNSSFFYEWQADSFLLQNDSINAGRVFMKVNPYLIFFEKVTPDSIYSFLSRNYKIPETYKKEYCKYFAEISDHPKSASYKKFVEMADEDQRLRHELDNCVDSLCNAVTYSQMEKTDKIHFEYLQEYIKKYGWPSLENGSMPATLLAIHDHAHHKEYFPILKQAVINGQADMGALRLINAWNKSKDFSVIDYLAKHTHKLFDVSCMMENKMPENYQEIENFVKKHSHILHPFYLLKYNSLEKCRNYWAKINRTGLNYDVLSTLSIKLSEYVHKSNDDQRLYRAMKAGIYDARGLFTTDTIMRLYLCLPYESSEMKNFNKIIEYNKLITHSILFDYNKSTLKFESYSYIQQLASWLNQNTNIKLEIAGHTDNEGNPASNLILSQARADEVKRQLVSLGVDSTRLTTKGYGDTKPIQPNTTPEGKANNRRVEFIKQ